MPETPLWEGRVLLLLGLALGEDDLVDKEEDHHGDTAVEHHGTDVVDKSGHEQTGHRHPDAVNGVDDAGDDAEGDDVPQDLVGQVALAAEDQVALEMCIRDSIFGGYL